jgi:hypothetical protein
MRIRLGLLCALVTLMLLVLPMAGRGAQAAAAPELMPYAVVTMNGVPTIPSPLTAEPGDPAAGQQVVIERMAAYSCDSQQ